MIVPDEASPEPIEEAAPRGNQQIHLFLKCEKTMQNQLLAELLTVKTGFPTTYGPSFCVVRPGENEQFRYLILFDCHGISQDKIWSSLSMITFNNGLSTMVALFNVLPGLINQMNKAAMARGIKGLFSEDHSLDVLVKGIKRIATGELWYTRKSMCRFLEKTISCS